MGVYIPQHLNHRRLIVGLPVEEFLAVVVPSALGFMVGHSAMGLGVSAVSVLGLRALKKACHGFSPFLVGYLWIPAFTTALPPAHWRWVGG